VIAGSRQHVVIYENGAAARNAAVQFHLVDDDDGTIDPDAIAWALEAAAHHQPTPSLICIENTHMPADGAPWPLERLKEVAAAGAGLPLHMDGARLFHAEVATGTAASDYASVATTVMCCLSKGLAAPVGSMLAGPSDLIGEARALRSSFGGGMRQAGVIAAAGVVALQTMIDRLAEDHERARRLAEAVALRWPESGVDPGRVRTNIVTFGHRSPSELIDHLRRAGVLAGTIAPGVVRLVTHVDVDDAGVDLARRAIADAP
jgi:threonine aldolase